MDNDLIKCPKCGSDVVTVNRFCGKCGYEFEEKTKNTIDLSVCNQNEQPCSNSDQGTLVTYKRKVLSTNVIIGLSGVILMLIGFFFPAYQEVATVTYPARVFTYSIFYELVRDKDAHYIGVIILVMAIVLAILIIIKNYKYLLISVGLTAIIVLIALINLIVNTNSISNHLSAYFGPSINLMLVSNVLPWGWLVLFFGLGIITFSIFKKEY